MTGHGFKTGDRIRLTNVQGETDKGGPWRNGQPGVIHALKMKMPGSGGYAGADVGTLVGPAYNVRFDGFTYGSADDSHEAAECILELDDANDEEMAEALRSIASAYLGETVYDTPTGEHPAIIKMRERDEEAVAQGYTKGDVNHFTQPIIGMLRLRQRDQQPLSAADLEYAIKALHQACNAELAWLHEQGEL